MALTKTKNGKQNTNISLASGRLKIEVGTVAFDSSYPTGGEEISFPNFEVEPLFVAVQPDSGYIFTYDRTNGKLLAYYADYDAGSDGALIEVANETDLSGVDAAAYIAVGF